MSNISDIDLAYIAGIMDGEGSISILKKNSGRSRGYQRRIRLDVQISIANTNKKLMDYLQSKLGGYVYCSNKSNLTKWKIGYMWRMGADNAKKILELLLPFLKLKKEQALLAINLRNLKELPMNQRYNWVKFEKQEGWVGLGGYRVREEILKQELELEKQIRILNKKGPAI